MELGWCKLLATMTNLLLLLLTARNVLKTRNIRKISKAAAESPALAKRVCSVQLMTYSVTLVITRIQSRLFHPESKYDRRSAYSLMSSSQM